MTTYTTANVGDLYTGDDGVTGTVTAVGATITVDTGERLPFPAPYGATRTLTFLYSAVPGTFTHTPEENR